MYKISEALRQAGFHAPYTRLAFFEEAWEEVKLSLSAQGFSNIVLSAQVQKLHSFRSMSFHFGCRHGRLRFPGKGMFFVTYPVATLTGDIRHAGVEVAWFRKQARRKLRLKCNLLDYVMQVDRRGYENYTPGSANCA